MGSRYASVAIRGADRYRGHVRKRRTYTQQARLSLRTVARSRVAFLLDGFAYTLVANWSRNTSFVTFPDEVRGQPFNALQ